MADSKNRVEEILKKIVAFTEHAETKPTKAAKYKHITDSCNNIVKEEDERLNIVVNKKTGEITNKPNVSHRYYLAIREDYRNAIKSLNLKHHDIEKKVNAFVNKYSGEVDGLAEMLNPALNIQTLRDNLIKLRANAKTGSNFKRDLLKLKIEHHAYYSFEPKGSYKDFVSDDSKRKLREKLNNQILVNPEWIKNLVDGLLTKKEPNASDLAIGISIATGRRLTEVMKSADFKAVNKTTLLFSGQLKTKNRHLFEEITPYEIPCLIDTAIVCKALKKLRKMTEAEVVKFRDVQGQLITRKVGECDFRDYYHNRSIKYKYSSTMNRSIKILLNDGFFSFKDCRALYTEITYDHHSKESESRSAYRHRVLGHSLIETQIHYECFKIDKNIESVKVVVNKSDNETIDDVQKALVEYLKKADEDVDKSSVRAPKMAIMHKWLKQKVTDGLTHEEITASYIRRFCLIEGTQTNLNTIKKYINELVKISDFVPPKEKPKSKLDAEIMELEKELEMATDRKDEIVSEREDLENEKEELILRLPEIDEEIDTGAREEDVVDEQIDNLTDLLEELRNRKSAEEEQAGDQKANSKKEPDIVWPPADKIEITAKKTGKNWHAMATINDTVFEVEQPGTKKQALADVRSLYQSELDKQ